jgi:hypothetical protein
MALQPFVLPWPLFQFLDLFIQSAGFLGREISPSQSRYLHTGRYKHKIKRTQTSMPQVGFEHTTPVFKWAKTVDALDRAASVIGAKTLRNLNYGCVQLDQIYNRFNTPSLFEFERKKNSFNFFRNAPKVIVITKTGEIICTERRKKTKWSTLWRKRPRRRC